MRSLVSRLEFESVLDTLLKENVLAIDLETTGLSPYKGHRLFSVAICTEKLDCYYFNFNTPQVGDNSEPEHVFLPFEKVGYFRTLLSDETKLWIGHNIGFDWSFLEAANVPIKGSLWDTRTMTRVCLNNLPHRYSLKDCAKLVGEEKLDTVEKYMDEHKLFSKVKVEGKEKEIKNYFFNKVPLHVIASYAMQDAAIAMKLYRWQKSIIEEVKPNIPSLFPVSELERKTTLNLCSMKKVGLRLDKEYCEEAAAYYSYRLKKIEQTFKMRWGFDLVLSAKSLKPIFKELGIELPKTDKGNDSLDHESLSKVEHPLAKEILEYRDYSKRLNTYFSSFLYFMDPDSRIRCYLDQAGTSTGRFSAREPNLQNLTDDSDDATYPIRRAFVADEGFYILSCDYQAMEYRVMLDYADEETVIQAVLRGEDLHETCAKMMGVDRKTAKTINFMLLYGGGAQKLADELKVSLDEATKLRALYFRKLPNVKTFLRKVQDVSQARGYVYNWLGRRYIFEKEKAYKATNYLIQGGCSDIMRTAVDNVTHILSDKKSKLVLTIHDELVILLHESELEIIPLIKTTMIKAYKHKKLPMDVGVSIGKTLHCLEDFEIWLKNKKQN